MAEYLPPVLENIVNQYKEQLLGSYSKDGMLYVEDPTNGKLLAKKEGYSHIFFFPAHNRYLLISNETGKTIYGNCGEQKNLLRTPNKEETFREFSYPMQTRNSLYITQRGEYYKYFKVDPLTLGIKVEDGHFVCASYDDRYIVVKPKTSSYSDVFTEGKKLGEFLASTVIDIAGKGDQYRYIIERTDPRRRYSLIVEPEEFFRDYTMFENGENYRDVIFTPQSTENTMAPIKFIDMNTVISVERLNPSMIRLYRCDISNTENIKYTPLFDVNGYGLDGTFDSVMTDDAIVMRFSSIASGLRKCFVIGYAGLIKSFEFVKDYESITML